MAVNSKNKGSSFERVISKQLTEWWNNGGMEGKFFRTPGSGALAYRMQKDVIGDIAVPEGFPFTIECKNQEGWKLEDLFKKDGEAKKGIPEWWQQAWTESERAKKIPLLIMKKNFYDPLVMIDVTGFCRYCAKRGYTINLVRTYTVTGLDDNPVTTEVLVVRLDELLEYTEPKDYIQTQ